MAKITDVEDILDLVKANIVANFNTKVTAIEAVKIAEGKGVTPTLAAVSATEGYFLQTWVDAIYNITPAIFYGIEGVKNVEDGGGAINKVYIVAVYIVLVDSGQTNDMALRLFRYSRALEEIFKNFDLDGFSKVKMETVLPISFPRDVDSSEEIKMSGITLTIPLA